MRDGVRHPNLVAPVGTHTGWNLRRSGFAKGAQCAGTGSFIPFAVNRHVRESGCDPRVSLAERYPTVAAYVGAVASAADRLVAERLLLPADAERIVDLAENAMADADWLLSTGSAAAR